MPDPNPLSSGRSTNSASHTRTWWYVTSSGKVKFQGQIRGSAFVKPTWADGSTSLDQHSLPFTESASNVCTGRWAALGKLIPRVPFLPRRFCREDPALSVVWNQMILSVNSLDLLQPDGSLSNAVDSLISP